MDAPQARYDRLAVWLHWLIGAALLAETVFGFLLDEIAPRNTPPRAPVINLHKSIGVVLGVLVVVRLLWRIRHAPPAWPPGFAVWKQLAAEWGHRAMYACMVLMPLCGYIASNFSKHGVRFFGLALRPWGPDLPGVYAFFSGLHVVSAYVFTVLVVGHIAVAFWHLLIERDQVFWRMWPARARTAQPGRRDIPAPTGRTP